MQTSTQNETSLDPMDIARVARLLWRQAGSQPGRYAEYWTRVEQALAYAQNAREIESLNDQGSLASQRNGSRDLVARSEQSALATQEQIAGTQPMAREDNEGTQAPPPASNRAQPEC